MSLLSINNIVLLTNSPEPMDSVIPKIINNIIDVLRYAGLESVLIKIDTRDYISDNFIKSLNVHSFSLNLPENRFGEISLYYKDDSYINNKEIINFTTLISNILIGYINKCKISEINLNSTSNRELQDLLERNRERLKELKGINRTSEILNRNGYIEESLQEICNILPESWKHPENTVIRITYDDKIFTSKNFKESSFSQSESFKCPRNRRGTIEVFLLKEYPLDDEGPFLKEERELLFNISRLLSGRVGIDVLNQLITENGERLKELGAINRTSQIISEYKPVDQTMSDIISILKVSWQYPEFTEVKIHYEGDDYISDGYIESLWSQEENFITVDNNKGYIRVVYLKELPFLQEERDLLVNIGKLISSYFNDKKGREIIRKNTHEKRDIVNSNQYNESLVKDKRPLHQLFNKQVLDKYIYLDMMKYKVKEILFVATFYDAFILENEDGFFERFMGEIYQYSLFSLPRITGVTTPEEALDILDSKSFDLVILMVGLDKVAPVELSKRIKEKVPSLPIYLLLNQKCNLKYFEEKVATIKSLDNIFFWSGNSDVLFSIVKSIEDRANISNDTKVGLVRVILIVEDSSLYYSKFLQIVYSIVFGQVQKLLPEVEKNEIDKICKMRSRPKVVLAKNFEDAMYLFNKYKDYLLCVISDVEYDRGGQIDRRSGFDFIKYVKSHLMNLPVILQSSESKNRKIAEELGLYFINKNSNSLYHDMKKYINSSLGFGNFSFLNSNKEVIAEAKTLKEFKKLLKTVPDETFYLHAMENQYSIWLMARGEIALAKAINPIRVETIDNISVTRDIMIKIMEDTHDEKTRGKVFRYEEDTVLTEKNIVTFANGSLGGKGRGLAFINTLIYSFDFSAVSDQINIRTPKTAIIGTKEFDSFIHSNKIYDKLTGSEQSFSEIKDIFVSGRLSKYMVKKLKAFVDQVEKPIAVRSSSLSEDSFTQPFAGVFHTYLLPNNRDNRDLTLRKLKESVKLVFASVFSDEAKGYYKAINHRVEDEKMAVVLQELVGNRFDDYYYPHISGTACSYNYYPVAHMKPEEGFAMVALGLGSYVVDGMSSFRFSPTYPKVDMYSNKDLINSSQVKFYALDCSADDKNYTVDGELASLKLLDIDVAEEHGSIKHCVSVYDVENDRIVPGLSAAGPRIINFGNILKYNYIPLAKTLEILLSTINEALGSPVEIEFAVDLNRTENGLPTFYLLQTKPMVDSRKSVGFNIDSMDRSKALLYTETSLGNGEINTVYDIIYVDNNSFDKLKTLEMVNEIEFLNKLMVEENRPYVLIGPGRWGTRDQFLGIPVNWSQISNAKIIVEVSLDNFPLDASLGSHFFHNVTSMNIGYFSVNNKKDSEFINWDNLSEQTLINKTTYFKHIRYNKPLDIMMDGKNKKSIIVGGL